MNKKVKYDINYLQSFCKDNSIELLEPYTSVNRDTKIKGKCKKELCKEIFYKSFRRLVENKPYCSECCKINGKEKSKKTFLEKYGCEYATQNKEIKEKSKKTNLEKYGCENPFQNKEIKEKIKQKNLEKYGCEYYLQTKEKQQKSKNTCLEKYGVENCMQNKEIRNKVKQTFIEKYGVENCMQSEKFKNKVKQTMVERYGAETSFQSIVIKERIEKTMTHRYGVKYTTQNKELLDKVKQTFLEKYGVENPFQSDEIKNKSKKTSLEKYGCEYPMQNIEIMEKSSKNAYKLKDYTFPSGSQIQYQGYEKYALDELLLSGILEEDIINGCKNVPEVWYEDTQGKKHRHYIDIFIPSQNRCIEVKSTWTAEKKKDCIFLKQDAGKSLGYNYEIWVYDGKGEKVECYK